MFSRKLFTTAIAGSTLPLSFFTYKALKSEDKHQHPQVSPIQKNQSSNALLESLCGSISSTTMNFQTLQNINKFSLQAGNVSGTTTPSSKLSPTPSSNLPAISTTSTSSSTTLFSSYSFSQQCLQHNIFGNLNLHRKEFTTAVILTHLAIFGAWQIPSINYFMHRNFTSSSFGFFRQKLFHTALTSTMSHSTFLHFLFNNIAIYSILPQFERIWGTKKTASIYVGSAIVSSLLYLTAHQVIENTARRSGWATPTLINALRVPSLGASGVVASLFVCYANMFPQAKFQIMFIPYPIDAMTLMSAFACFDLAGFGAMLYRGYGFMNLCHTGHLAGYLTGYLIYKFCDPYNKKRTRRHLESKKFW